VPKVADNSFEDCEKIFVVKVKEEIAVYCKCLELGEDCSSSLLCCSGYCNDTVKKCDMPPICPQQLRCPGAPTGGGKGDNAWIDFNGVVCCPLENIGDDSGPVCSNKHCCPTHKPKWCGKPIKGEPRCMSEDEFENECEKKATFVILFIQLNQKISNFKEKAESAKDFWVELTPLKNCPQNVEAVVVEDKVCDVPSDQSSLCRCFETQNPYYCSLAESIFKTTMNNIEKCARSWGFDGKYVRVEGVLPGTYICKSGGGGILGYTNLYETRLVSSEAGILSTTSHEMGHTYGLCDEGYGGGYCSGCASGYCASSGTDICVGDGYCCPNKPEYNSIMCSSNKCGTRCSPGSRFASTSYAHLEKELSKYCS
jgi:hypothetical protein